MGPSGSDGRQRVGDVGAGQVRSEAKPPCFATLFPSSPLFYSSYFCSGFIKWMLRLTTAPLLRCRTAASRAGQVPAPGRWRRAIRRASFDSLSQLPLFNQIIGKVNLLDSHSSQPPPFPRSPQPPCARAAHAWGSSKATLNAAQRQSPPQIFIC